MILCNTCFTFSLLWLVCGLMLAGHQVATEASSAGQGRENTVKVLGLG